MPAILQARDAELAALMVRDEQRAKALAEEFGAPSYYSDWRALLADPNVDAVHIATPLYLHAEQVVAAAQAGKNVLCDKPMALTTAECRRMIDACSDNGVHLQIAFLMRFSSIHQRLRQEISQGRFGTILSARASILKWLPLADDAWRVIPEQGGGGPLMDLGSHTIDLLSFLLGPMKSAVAVASNLASKWRVEDTASVLLSAESGTHVVVEHSFRTKGGDQTVEINGTEGSAVISTPPPGGEKPTLRIADAQGVHVEPMPFENYYQLQIEHFSDCLARETEPLVTGEDGLHNLAVIEAAYRSVRTRKVEAVER
jgi:predicted dehydrogenase